MQNKIESAEHRQRRLRRETLRRDLNEIPEESLSDDFDQRDRHDLVGLGFKQAIKRHGTRWLQADQLLWEAFPTLWPGFVNKLR